MKTKRLISLLLAAVFVLRLVFKLQNKHAQHMVEKERAKAETLKMIRISVYSDNLAIFWKSVQEAFARAGFDILRNYPCPTDAAGGVVDGGTAAALERQGRSIHAALANNDAYPALRSVGGLIMTGPTGTNVNDVAVVLIRGRKGENA